MKKSRSVSFFLTVFLLGLAGICLELFLSQVLYLKAWDHVVYTVIPFALLGFGIGANILLVAEQKILRYPPGRVLPAGLFVLSFLLLPVFYLLIRFPLHLSYLVELFLRPVVFLKLAFFYCIFMLPFIPIGFLLAYVFRLRPQASPGLYFFDLLGAGLGSVVFVVLIRSVGLFPGTALLAIVLFFLGVGFVVKRKMSLLCVGILAACLAVFFVPEVSGYRIDPSKGWEWIPGLYPPSAYETVVRQWHPLGRTDCYRIHKADVRRDLTAKNFGTFMINLEPPPPLTYCVTNFLSGTPVFQFNAAMMKALNPRLNLFSLGFEAPYTLLREPRVVVIGAGGGRDIFLAKIHRAQSIIGAEINPVLYRHMSPGGELYAYSGEIYTGRDTRILNTDGRHLVRTLLPGSQDLVVLNAADTFSGLSTGAYAYAESYLYTREAVADYLRILHDGGMINFNRWIDVRQPKETLRLFIISMAALESIGAEKPWQHVLVGKMGGWSILLVKKAAFTPKERQAVRQYLEKLGLRLVYPSGKWLETGRSQPIMYKGKPQRNYFEFYAQALMQGKDKQFIKAYPYDVSVVTDDRPFFYNFYKLAYFNPHKIFRDHHHSPVIFLTQMLVLSVAGLFVILFILIPLGIFQRRGFTLAGQAAVPFCLYFGALGLGYMLIELTLLQRFVVLLGSPIYSLSVTLPALLMATGLGSALCLYSQKWFKSRRMALLMATVWLCAYLIYVFIIPRPFLGLWAGFAFPVRALLVSFLILPLGLALGMFFPLGLKSLSPSLERAVPWAFGVNAGFSVLGGMLAIVMAQFMGFNRLLWIALGLYWLALWAYLRWVPKRSE